VGDIRMGEGAEEERRVARRRHLAHRWQFSAIRRREMPIITALEEELL